MTESTKDLTGLFLVASPQMQDPNFEKTVILMIGHDPQRGALGVVINRESPISLEDVCRQLKLEALESWQNCRVGWGGPVHEGYGYIVHTAHLDAEQEDIYHDERIGVTISVQCIADICKGTGPQDFMLVLGCAGWDAGQLESEMAQDAWLVAPADPNILFHTPLHDRYDAALAIVGMSHDDLKRVGGAFGLAVGGHA